MLPFKGHCAKIGIYILHKNNPFICCLDVANYMSYSKPRVSRAVGLLKKADYITANQDRYIMLTKAGKKIAKTIYDRYITLTKALMMFSIDEKTVAEDAYKI